MALLTVGGAEPHGTLEPPTAEYTAGLGGKKPIICVVGSMAFRRATPWRTMPPTKLNLPPM